ncbi:MAG: flagellar protein FlaG [Candidatus Thorarchaeota archaeon]|jgi:flagellar protein FlaG
MNINSINQMKASIERPESVVSSKGREKSQESNDAYDKSTAVTRAELDQSVDYANEAGKLLKRKLNFAIDDTTDKVVVRVIEEESGDVIRQIPAAEMLRISAHLKQLREMNDQVIGAVKSVILDVTY